MCRTLQLSDHAVPETTADCQDSNNQSHAVFAHEPLKRPQEAAGIALKFDL